MRSGCTFAVTLIGLSLLGRVRLLCRMFDLYFGSGYGWQFSLKRLGEPKSDRRDSGLGAELGGEAIDTHAENTLEFISEQSLAGVKGCGMHLLQLDSAFWRSGKELLGRDSLTRGKCDFDHMVEHENPGMGIVQLKVVPMEVQNRQHHLVFHIHPGFWCRGDHVYAPAIISSDNPYRDLQVWC